MFSSGAATARTFRVDGTSAPAVLRHDSRSEYWAITPDGQRVVTTSHEGMARLWRVAEPREPRVLRHEAAVRAAVFAPDGARVVTVGDDNQARFWSVRDEQEVLTLEPRQGALTSAVFSPDGRWLATLTEAGLVRLWRLYEWPELNDRLATAACLTPSQREKILGEDPLRARRAYETRERGLGR